MNTNELVQLFIRKPWWINEGAPRTARKLNSSLDDVTEARRIYFEYKKSGKLNQRFVPKILIFDIETAPMKAYVWKRWKENISLEQTISEWFCIAWSAKWLYSGEVMGEAVTPEEALHEDDCRIMAKLYDLISKADIIIAHNGDNFDIPKINARFIIHGFPPYKPVFSIDTLKVAKRQFGFSSNKLDALAGYFGIPHKMDTDFSLWKRCMGGNQEALDYMLEYNKKDVTILEEVYLKLRPWIKGHPNINTIYNDIEDVKCCNCGSGRLEILEGQYYCTSVGQYALYRCKDCGALSRGRKALNKIKDIKTTSVGR